MNHRRMRVLQIVKDRSRECGVGLFAENLRQQMRSADVELVPVDSLPGDVAADIVLLQHHGELFHDDDIDEMAAVCPVPFVLFAHDEGADRVSAHVDGYIAMCAGMVGPTDKPLHVFAHPAWTPPRLEDRTALRREFGKPEGRTILGTNGFLKFGRQFAETVEMLLPEVRRHGWFVDLATSPWRLDSPGLVAKLEHLRDRNPDHFGFEHAFLDTKTLNRRLQACDLLWCWTAEPSSPYASGVISDQYASGTRVFAANKTQHQHVLALPNVVSGPDELGPFVKRLVTEAIACQGQRHEPGPVSWDHCVGSVASFLRSVASGNG